MASKLRRVALTTSVALSAGGLGAVPAQAATNYVTRPSVSRAGHVTPESAILSGVVDTGGDPGTAISGASSVTPFMFGGLSVTAGSSILNGFPVNQGYYSTVLFEADPLKDYLANGGQPGPDVVTAATVDVPVSAGLSPVSVRIGGTQARAQQNGSSPLSPGTRYVYFIQQQTGVTNAATTVNEYSASDLAAWTSGIGSLDGNGWLSSTRVTGSNDYSAWAKGSGNYVTAAGAPDPSDPSLVPNSLVNPDWQCVPDRSPIAVEATTGLAMPAITSLTSNTNPAWQAELAAGRVPIAPGSTSLGATALPYGVASAGADGTFTATAHQEPAEQGACLYYYGGNGSLYYYSPVGYFTTPKLGRIVVKHVAVAGNRIALTIADLSTVDARGSLRLTVGGRTIASGRFRTVAHGTGVATLRLNVTGVASAKKHSAARLVLVSSENDQPLDGKAIRL